MSNDRRPDQTIGDATAPARVRLLDADGHRWRVHETPAPNFDRRSTPHLVFDSETVVRRVRNFPANWFELSDQALYALTDYSASRANTDRGD